MANASYDTLTIKINADSKQANSSLKSLSTNLEKLNKVAQEIDTGRITKVKGLLLDIAKIDFSNVSKGLQDVVSAFKSFNNAKFTKQFQNGFNFTNAYEMPSVQLNKLGQDKFELKDYQRIDKLTNKLNLLPQPLKEFNAEIDLTKKQLKELGFSTKISFLPFVEQDLQKMGLINEQIDNVVGKIKNSIKSVIDKKQIKQIKQMLIEQGFGKKEANSIANNIRNGNKKGLSGAEKTWRQFGSLLRNRILRKIIQAIYQAFQQGIQSVISFDNETANSFNEIKSSLTYFINSIGAIISPLMNLIQPILTLIIDGLAEINNMLGEMFSTLSGDDSVIQATKEVEDYASALKKTQSIGIDELNVLSQENKGGFETKQADNVSNQFGEAFGQLKEILQPVMQTLKEITATLKPVLEAIGDLFKSLMPVLNVIISLINQFFGSTAESVNGAIAQIIELLAKVVEVIGRILNGLRPLLEAIITVVSYVIDIIADVIGDVVEGLISILEPLMEVVSAIFEALKPVFNAIKNIFNTLMPILRGIINVINQLANSFLQPIIKILNVLTPVLKAIGGALGADIDNRSKGERVFWGILSLGGSEILGALSKQQYATGGFPEDGLFYANHNELIGKFDNGRTVVANNEQITDGIYRAVLQAMRDSGGQGITIEMDGQKMAKAITKRQNNFGSDLLIGGNINYGK